jgi:type IV pilus assembly protein PilV
MTKHLKSRPRQSRQAGVALLEVLVSILLFSLGLLGLIGLQARAISFSVDAEDRNRASLIANEIATTMWLNKSVTVATGTGSDWEARVKDQTKGGLPSGEVSVTAVSGTTNSADILVQWKAPQRLSSEAKSQLTTRVTLPPT